MDIFQFANPKYLYFLLIIPVLIIIFIINRIIRTRALKRFGDNHIISQLMPEVSARRPLFKFIIFILGLSSLIITIAGPQLGAKLEKVKRKGVEIIIALDVSYSMLAEDIRPNRLENAKLAISKLVEKLTEDKIGLIVFAGDAYTQIPITTDYSSTGLFLESINPGIVPKQGTAIGAAIKHAMKSFTSDNSKNRAIVVITDGENHEDNAIEAAQEAAKQGITVHTIGMGMPEGTPLQIPGTNEFMKDRSGNVIVSKLDIATLQQVAAAGNGIYIQANNSSSALNTVFDEINKMEKQEIEAKKYSEYDEKFQYPVALAIFFLFIEIIILERRNRIFKNFNLFKTNI